ncbi:hypothetical protein [Thermococcus sp.]|uniref:HEAT repeat domain-containing protein n=1 Tax=Thermococcus sp. TaxID=35749 RepID=UPI002628A624|nr:hypothetical protein [Thermococcus sp.]
MAFLSFGSKRDKIKKLIMNERFDEVLPMVIKDKKALNGLVELLDDPAPGIRGDTLLLLGEVLRQNRDVLKPHVKVVLLKALEMTRNRNPYVKENAMVLLYGMIRELPTELGTLRGEVVDELIEEIDEGDSTTKAFAAFILGELNAIEAVPKLEGLVDVEEKVILPFEGKKWVPLGEIARESLEKLG